MPPRRPTPLLLSLHGLRAGVLLDSPRLADVAAEWLGSAKSESAGRTDIEGVVLPYAESDVLRHVSADAVRVGGVDPLLEIYQAGERFWLVDERWGMCELNLLRRSWRSWVLPDTNLDDSRLFEASVLWPMAQLCRGSGLHLIPASAVGRDGRGVLILSPLDVGPELDALAADGVGVIGRRWVCLRETPGGGVTLLSMPGLGGGLPAMTCRLVLIVEPMRRERAGEMPLNFAAGRDAIKDVWPVPLLSAGGSSAAGSNRLAAALARTCAVHRVRLGRSGSDLSRMLVRAAPANLRAAAA